MKINRTPTPILVKNLMLILVLTSFLVISTSARVEAKENYENLAEIEGKVMIDVYYFYFNPCVSCDVRTEFLIRLDTILGENKNDINLKMFNAFYPSVDEKLRGFYETFDVDSADRSPPILFIGNTYIHGSANIDERLLNEFKIAQEEKFNLAREIEADDNEAISLLKPLNSENSDTISRILYFYVPLCADCDLVEAYLNQLPANFIINHNGSQINSRVELLKFNISTMENLELIRKYFRLFGIAEGNQQVPIIFIGETYLLGSYEISNKLENLIVSGTGLTTPLFDNYQETDIYNDSQLTKFDFAGIVTAGLLNGLNPCSISMLLFFLSTITTKGLMVVKLGLSFIIARFVTYVLLGTILFNVFVNIETELLENIGMVLRYGFILIIVFLVIFNIWDYFAAKDEKYDRIKLQLPIALRRINHKWINYFMSVKNPRLLLLSGFILGVVISFGEFLCTGQIYILTLVYVMQISPQFDIITFASFLIYGMALIIPMLLLLLVVYKGKEVFEVSEMVRSNFKYIKLINAAAFAIFGIVLILFF